MVPPPFMPSCHAPLCSSIPTKGGEAFGGGVERWRRERGSGGCGRLGGARITSKKVGNPRSENTSDVLLNTPLAERTWLPEDNRLKPAVHGFRLRFRRRGQYHAHVGYSVESFRLRLGKLRVVVRLGRFPVFFQFWECKPTLLRLRKWVPNSPGERPATLSFFRFVR